jgi:hypothetical protein
MMRAVLAFPPKDSESSLVSLDSLYGTKLLSLPSVRALITFPKVVRERLIPFASFKVYPLAPVFPTFSDPAKSTRYNFPILTD